VTTAGYGFGPGCTSEPSRPDPASEGSGWLTLRPHRHSDRHRGWAAAAPGCHSVGL